MKITIINGTNRVNNESIKVSKAVKAIADEKKHNTYIVDLTNFTELFSGEYINYDNANEAQKVDLKNMEEANILILVVPTYHYGIPSPLKNFLDILKYNPMFENKMIGFIANSSNTYGLRQAQQVVNGIIVYEKLNSLVLPREVVTMSNQIDEKRLAEYIDYCVDITSKHSF